MNLLFVPGGSRGDRQPFGLVADELLARGHSVSVWADRNPGIYSGSPKIKYLLCREGAKSDDSSKGATSKKSKLHILNAYLFPKLEVASKKRLNTSNEFYRAILGRHAVVCHPETISQVDSVCEVLRIPYFVISPQLMFPSSSYRSLIFPSINLKAYNVATHKIHQFILWRKTRGWVNAFRIGQLGLNELSFKRFCEPRAKMFYIALSPHLFQAPEDWPKNHILCGAIKPAYKALALLTAANGNEELAPYFVFTLGSHRAVNPDAIYRFLQALCTKLKMKCLWVLGGSASPT